MRGNVFFHSVSRLNRVAVNNKQYNTPDITLTVTSLHTHYCQTDCHSLANNSLTTVDLQQLKERYFQQSSSSWREAFSRSLPSLRLFARTVSPPLAAGPRSLLHPCRGRSGGSRWSTVGHRLISNKYITNFTNSLFSIHSAFIHFTQKHKHMTTAITVSHRLPRSVTLQLGLLSFSCGHCLVLSFSRLFFNAMNSFPCNCEWVLRAVNEVHLATHTMWLTTVPDKKWNITEMTIYFCTILQYYKQLFNWCSAWFFYTTRNTFYGGR